MKKNILSFVILSVLCVLTGKSQSFHLTQYPALQPFLNPASETNSYESRMKVFYRSQWRSLGDPYISYGASYFRGFQHYQIGVTGIQNQVGHGISQTQVGLSQGFNMHIDHSDLLTIAGQIGVLQRKLSADNLSFASQFDKLTNTYDPTLSSGEGVANQTHVKPIVCAGAYWRHDGDESTMYGSLSASYLNRPYQNFTTVNDRMYIRTVAQMGVNFRFGHNMYLDPNILYVRQKDSYVLNVFFNTHHRLSDDFVASVGFGYRKNDAFLVSTGLAYNDLVLGVSYDINLSPLTTYTYGRGAFELSLSYRIKHRDPHIMRKDTSVHIVEHKQRHIKHPIHHPSHHYIKKSKGADVPPATDMPNKPAAVDTVSKPVSPTNAIPKYYVKDTDSDGIADSLDQCPTEKGTLKNLGCPESTPDRDNDGVPDDKDYCPEVFGAVASNGCPLSKGKIWELFQKEKHLEDILFDINSAKLLPRYNKALDEIAARLKQYEYLNLVICGHSDKVGNSTYNYQLSKQRADAIENYLISKGVARKQLNFFYYGETKPKTSTGKEDVGNRRVELFYTE